MDSGERAPTGALAAESTWVSDPIEVSDEAGWAEPLSWLAEHVSSVEALHGLGWQVELEIRVVARDPLTKARIPNELIQLLAQFESLPVWLFILPKPTLLGAG